MVRKKLALAILALSALQADLASALGLGSLSVKSSLNQPLNAEIRLLDTGDLDPAQIKIRLATQEDFERAGVDRNYFLTNLKFEINMDGRGSGVIHISTREPVVEPYLNFVVEARWPSGRLLREFAVLLDPPTFSGGAAQTAPRAAMTSQPAVPSRELTPPTVTAESTGSTAERLESNTLPESTNSGEHRVQVGETLSQIASRFRPATDVTAQQTMLAIQRSNPDAFINNNINLVRAGAILRLPSADEARTVAAGEAGQLIAEQSHAWRGGAASAGGEAASGPQLDASQPESSAEGGYQEKERLTIATPGNSAKTTVGEGSGSSSKGVEALRNQLSASQEGLDSAKRDNQELQSRLSEMEAQMATLQRLIAMKDDQLSALQSKAAGAPSAAAPAASATSSEPAIAEAPSAPESTPVAEAPSPAPAPVAAKPQPVAKPAPKPMPEPGLVDKLLGNPLYLGGGVAALLLAIGGAVFMKKRREQLEQESAGEELDLIDYTGDSSSAEPDFNFDNALVSDDAIADADSAATTPISMEPEKKAVRSETGDAIAEADIYIAYGRYQQAVDLLTGAIDAEPNRADLRVKLLEVLLEMRNRDAFRQQFMALQSLGDADAVVQVKEMLSSVDGVSDWLNDLPTSSSASAGVSAFAMGAAATAVAAATALSEDNVETEASTDLELDLDLDDSLLDTPSQVSSFMDAPASTPELEAALDDLDLDLDLDGDDAGADLDLALDLDAETLDFGSEPTSNEPAPTADFSLNLDTRFDESSAADDLELDLDDAELELDLNEEDLDFALKAMEGDEAPTATQNLTAAADLSEFDLSLAGDELSLDTAKESAEEARQALEADLGDLGDLGSLDDLGDLGLDDAGFAAETAAAPAFEQSFEAAAPAFAEPAFAELEPEPAPVAAAPVSGDDFDFLADTDEVATKLDLARAYIDMGDTDGAKDILGEVLQEGSDVQKQEAGELMDRIA